ncbi:MAG: peptide chain release factor aRF-1 [Candidatus Bathyarchaeota archaeon]|nr:peptide chain release factor 1 [Candidatus Bathyarchaeota archaeon A05DMB-5]MDH7558264.1 peptide chain release factor aRF-1 [Candidatus Bathyarchaeota archaeon]
MSTPKRTSLELFRLKKTLDTLARKEGRGTELVSLYVPPGKQISEVMNMLRDEYGTASNIKSTTTRKNVQEAIVKVQQRLKLFKETPENGLVIFCGAIPQNGAGSERIETYVIIPPEPIHIYLYRCDSRFHTEHLQELLREKETYGILLVDASAATLATLQGRRLEIVRQISSGVPGKTRAGGQSARRYERLREMRLQEYFRRLGEHANETFLPIENLKGLIIAGPGPTKFDFEKGDYLNYMLKEKVIDVIDTAYVDEQGVKEVVDKAPEIMRKIRYIEEKRVMQQFLYEIGHDTGMATYGEEEVRKALEAGAVRTLLLSEGIDIVRVKIKCNACGYEEQETIKNQMLTNFEQSLVGKPCPKCKAPSLAIAEMQELIENFAQLAEYTNTEVEVISGETEEGQMLKNSFGGIAAILRFNLQRD